MQVPADLPAGRQASQKALKKENADYFACGEEVATEARKHGILFFSQASLHAIKLIYIPLPFLEINFNHYLNVCCGTRRATETYSYYYGESHISCNNSNGLRLIR